MAAPFLAVPGMMQGDLWATVAMVAIFVLILCVSAPASEQEQKAPLLQPDQLAQMLADAPNSRGLALSVLGDVVGEHNLGVRWGIGPLSTTVPTKEGMGLEARFGEDPLFAAQLTYLAHSLQGTEMPNHPAAPTSRNNNGDIMEGRLVMATVSSKTVNEAKAEIEALLRIHRRQDPKARVVILLPPVWKNRPERRILEEFLTEEQILFAQTWDLETAEAFSEFLNDLEPQGRQFKDVDVLIQAGTDVSDSFLKALKILETTDARVSTFFSIIQGATMWVFPLPASQILDMKRFTDLVVGSQA